MISYAKFCAKCKSIQELCGAEELKIESDNDSVFVGCELPKWIELGYGIRVMTTRHLYAPRKSDRQRKLEKHKAIFSHWLEAYKIGVKP